LHLTIRRGASCLLESQKRVRPFSVPVCNAPLETKMAVGRIGEACP